MRNPWRFSFDPVTGTCYAGHVGQTNSEWINIVTNGANCGWNYYEGSRQWTNSLPHGFVLTPPPWEYGHTNSRACIIGGVVYRGSRIPQLNGAYVYGDYSSGEIWSLRHIGMMLPEPRELSELLLIQDGFGDGCNGVPDHYFWVSKGTRS